MTKYKDYTKIVAIHRHMVPVPGTGADQITIVDTFDAFRSLTENKANLIRCGHCRRPWKWQEEKMPVIHAGSTGCERLRLLHLTQRHRD